MTDVLVVGAGAAGIRAALTAAQSGMEVTLVTDKPVCESGSSFYPLSPPWGVMYAEDEADAQAFAEEIVAAAGPCVNGKLVRLLAERSMEAHERLVKEGLPLRTHAEMGLVGCFGKASRGALLCDLNAAKLTWRHELAQANNLHVLEGLRCVSLLKRDDAVCGAVALDAQGEAVFLKAKAVVLATGGGTGLYEYGFTCGEPLGSAYAMAARHGARTVNLEFVQFINGALEPRYGLNYYQFAFVEHPRLENGRGETFLERYLPEGVSAERCMELRGTHGPFSVEDDGRFFDLSIVAETQAGHGFGARIVPNASSLQGAKYAHWRAFLARQDLPLDEPMTIYPFCQAFNGGVMLHDDLQTDLPGLFACGEAAGGMHGANRMGGNAILATQVFGELAGSAAAAYAQKASDVPISDSQAQHCFVKEFEEGAADLNACETLREIRRILQKDAFLIRNDAGLAAAEGELNKLVLSPMAALGRKDARAAFDARNAADAARLLVRSMRARKESRGGHFRSDHPQHAQDLERMLPMTLRA